MIKARDRVVAASLAVALAAVSTALLQQTVLADPLPVATGPVRSTPSPAPTANPKEVVEPYVEATPAAEPEPEPYVEPAYAPVVLSPTPYTTREQSAVDSGALVTWLDGSGGLPCLLGGHDHMGWYWIDDIPVGTHINVTQGACAGEWVVTENRWGPTSPHVHDWMYGYSGYLALQTCEAGGYGYTIAARV